MVCIFIARVTCTSWQRVSGFVLFSNNSNIIDPSQTMELTSIKKKNKKKNRSHLDPPQECNWWFIKKPHQKAIESTRGVHNMEMLGIKNIPESTQNFQSSIPNTSFLKISILIINLRLWKSQFGNDVSKCSAYGLPNTITGNACPAELAPLTVNQNCGK